MKLVLLPLLMLCLTVFGQPLLIKNATIIDVRNGDLLKDTDVLIEKNRITAIGKNLKSDSKTLIIDARNKYLIPGLWDMHGHFLSRWDRSAPIYVANGVTGVRDMATALPLHEVKDLRKKLIEGKVTGPRFITSGSLLDGPQTRFPQVALRIANKEQAMKVADSLKSAGVDFYKVYETLPKDAFYAIIEKGKEHGFSVTGHVPASIPMDEAMTSGMKGIEHLKFISPDQRLIPDSMRGIFRAAMWDLANKDTVSAIKKNKMGTEMSVKLFNPEDAVDRGRILANNNIWVTPTMVQSTSGHFNKEHLLTNKNWDYMPATIITRWRTRIIKDIRLMRFDYPEYAALELKTIEGFHKAGVKLMAGSDANDAFIGNIPGFSIHEEMELFVRSGLSNLEALQTATLNPAVYMEATDLLGTIDKNKIADLVLLDANPLENISNSKKIHAVILNGKFLDRKKLDVMLQEVKDRVKEL